MKENNEIKNEATGDELTDKLAKMFDESSDTELVNSIMEDIDGLQSDDFDEDEKIEEAEEIKESATVDEDEDYEDDDDEIIKRARKNMISTIITVIVAIIAVGACLMLFLSNQNDDVEDRYNPTATEQEEIKAATSELLVNNYNIIRMFYEEGLTVSHMTEVDEDSLVQGSAGADEMQDYKVETDNIYPVDDPTFKTYAQIEELVRKTLVPAAADELLKNGQGAGPVYCDKNGALSINLNNFQPIQYDKNWANISCEYKNITEKTVDVFVTLSYNDQSDKAGQNTTLSGNLVKTESGWRLEKIIY